METIVRYGCTATGGVAAERWWLARRDEGCRSVSADNGTLQICDVCSLCAREEVVLNVVVSCFLAKVQLRDDVRLGARMVMPSSSTDSNRRVIKKVVSMAAGVSALQM